MFIHRTSSQEGMGKVKAKAKVVIELLLSVQGYAICNLSCFTQPQMKVKVIKCPRCSRAGRPNHLRSILEVRSEARVP